MRSYQEGRMKRVNLDPDADFVGNRPPKPVDAKAIRKFSQQRPLIDIEDGDTLRGAQEDAEESRRQAVLAEKERSRAQHQAKAKPEAAPRAPKPVKAKLAAQRKKRQFTRDAEHRRRRHLKAPDLYRGRRQARYSGWRVQHAARAVRGRHRSHFRLAEQG